MAIILLTVLIAILSHVNTVRLHLSEQKDQKYESPSLNYD